MVTAGPRACVAAAVGPRRAARGRIAAVAVALLLVLAAALAGAAALAVDEAPQVTRPAALSAGDVAAGLGALLGWSGGATPAASPAGRATASSPTVSVVLSQRAASWLLDQAANRGLPSAARVELRPGTAFVRASIAVPAAPFGRWLNVEAVLREGELPPRVERLRLGRLPLPGRLGDLAVRRLVRHLDDRLARGSEEAAALRVLGGLLRGVAFRQGEARIAAEWDAAARARLVAALLPPARRERVRAYHARLAELTAAGPGSALSLTRLLVPMFALARERSAAGAPAAQENRAAIQTLALYVLGSGWRVFLPAAGAWPTPRRLAVTLAGRDDFPQHWLVSAVIAAEAGAPLADAIGLYKELDDTVRGSGFSFTDIAVDRAGTRFGVRAVEAPAAVQARIAAGVGEADLVPAVADLPEFMSAPEFARRFGAVGSPAYQRVLEAIEKRVAALPVLR